MIGCTHGPSLHGGSQRAPDGKGHDACLRLERRQRSHRRLQRAARAPEIKSASGVQGKSPGNERRRDQGLRAVPGGSAATPPLDPAPSPALLQPPPTSEEGCKGRLFTYFFSCLSTPALDKQKLSTLTKSENRCRLQEPSVSAGDTSHDENRDRLADARLPFPAECRYACIKTALRAVTCRRPDGAPSLGDFTPGRHLPFREADGRSPLHRVSRNAYIVGHILRRDSVEGPRSPRGLTEGVCGGMLVRRCHAERYRNARARTRRTGTEKGSHDGNIR